MSDNEPFVLTPFQQFCSEVVKVGRVPKHIAFILDGNRRYMEKQSLGYVNSISKGNDTVWNTVEWCCLLGIAEMTVFVFSIENFKRNECEVNTLMNTIRIKLAKKLADIDRLNKNGVRIKIVGRTSLLSEEVLMIFSEMEAATRNNTKLVLNFTLAYTGRDEISRTASRIVKKVQDEELSPEDIDEQLVTQMMDLSEPELLVRTSGEVRLSDFMLWQISNTVLYFTNVLWPEFSIWSLLAAIIHFQRHAPTQRNRRNQ